jgi:hypothetical protein
MEYVSIIIIIIIFSPMHENWKNSKRGKEKLQVCYRIMSFLIFLKIELVRTH